MTYEICELHTVVWFLSANGEMVVNINRIMREGMSTFARKCDRGMQDWGEPKQMPKNGLFGIRLVKRTPIIANIFFSEVPIPNEQHSSVHQTFAAPTNAVRSASATHPY